MALIPPFLKEGDTVLLIAPARARSQQQIKPAIDQLNSWGLKVEVGKNAFKVHHQFAGTDEERAEDFQWAIDHPIARAVITSGGGYGSLRIIDRVDVSSLHKFPKWFAGYSDTTVIHSRLLQSGFACIHGTMAFQFDKNAEATESLRTRLFGIDQVFSFSAHSLNREGFADAEIVGGNLSLVYALSGSKDDFDTRNKILFIEDLDEQLYHVDRMMMQLKRSGKLDQLAALVVGGMTDMKDNNIPYGMTAEEIIWDSVRDFDYPVCFGFPAGHVERNLSFYLGMRAQLRVEKIGATFSYPKR